MLVCPCCSAVVEVDSCSNITECTVGVHFFHVPIHLVTVAPTFQATHPGEAGRKPKVDAC